MKKVKLFIIGITFVILNPSCKSQYSVIELDNNFSNEQLSDLKKITTFFKNEMCPNRHYSFKTCYKRTPHESLEATGTAFWSNINFEKQKKLYKNISASTFNEIWSFCELKSTEKRVELTEICAKFNGKYQKYLMEYGQNNESIKKYAKRLIGSGDFNGLQLTYWQILNNKKDLDLNNPNIQLILAIHYLSLNDELKRNEKPKTPKIKF